jgi:sugar O-acyltransferase (sialic acid O-acetyltransferase NeuD family)
MARGAGDCRDLLILGVGVHAAEMAEIVERVNGAHPTWRLLGFIAPEEKYIGEQQNGYPILGTIDRVPDYSDACVVPAYGWPRRLPVPRDRLVSLVDPAAFVSRTATIGAGSVLYPHGFVGLNARLGEQVFCLSGSVINHDDVLEERVVVASGVCLAGSVHVEADCYLGQACTVREYVRIGRGSLIGMGAVVVKDVPPNSVIVGNPGRRLRDR